MYCKVSDDDVTLKCFGFGKILGLGLTKPPQHQPGMPKAMMGECVSCEKYSRLLNKRHTHTKHHKGKFVEKE